MGKTLHRTSKINAAKSSKPPSKPSDNNSLDDLMEELQPFLNQAKNQLLSPDDALIKSIIKKSSR